MKFFKHFVDAHRGKSLQRLLRGKDKDRGLKAIGVYWTIVELCAEKMAKKDEEVFTDAHCHFEFDLEYIRDTLGLHQTATCLMYVRCLTDVGLMSATCKDDVLSIYMPKLLECLDRDAKRARIVRDPCAPKNKKKIKEEDEEVPAAINPRFNSVNRFNQQFNPVVREFAEYIGTLPISYRLKAHAVDVHRTFEEVSEFKKFISSVIDAEKFQNLPTEESRQSYLTVSILRHCGVISA